jgi:hypothetical protein
MSDPFAKTQYRVGQHWRFRSDTPEARDILTILGVEDHPTLGIICNIHFEYDPPLEASPGSYASGGQYWLTQAALDRSVIEQIANEPLPRNSDATGEFARGPGSWDGCPFPAAVNRTVSELIRAQTERHKREQAVGADPRQSWEAAVAAYEQLAADGDDLAPWFRDLCRTLATTVTSSPLQARASEGCLEIYAPPGSGEQARGLRLAVVSELEEIRYCLDEFGKQPEGLDPECWRVELRGIVIGPDGGNVDQALEQWRCKGGPDTIAQFVVGLLPRLGALPTLCPPAMQPGRAEARPAPDRGFI